MAAPVRRWNSEVWQWMVGRNVSNVSALAIMIAAFVITVLIVVDLDLAPGRAHLRAGYNTYVPFAMKGPDGKPRGLAVEIVNRAAARAGIDLTWVAVSDNVDDELRRGHVDVETCGQLDAAITMGCDTAQGYYLGRPAPPISGSDGMELLQHFTVSGAEKTKRPESLTPVISLHPEDEFSVSRQG